MERLELAYAAGGGEILRLDFLIVAQVTVLSTNFFFVEKSIKFANC